MTIAELKALFRNQLVSLYTSSESDWIFAAFIEKQKGLNRIEQQLYQNETVEETDVQKFLDILEELKTGKPYQQILGEAEFFGLSFYVDENVLIPRPETEELLELAISKIKALDKKNLKILDIGTGSGIIPIVLKINFPDAEITALDISDKALGIARKNADKHQTKIHFIQSDYLNEDLKEMYDVIISNPPYIGIDENPEIEHSVKGFEPNIALFSPTNDALIFYRKIAIDAEKYLNDKGLIFLEINQKLGKKTLMLYQTEIFEKAKLIKDISQNDRMIVAQKK